MYYKFEKLTVWQESRIFIGNIYLILKKFPRSEDFILAPQIKRAAISVALNIAEGSDKNSKKDFVRYLRISIGSINELITGLYIAKDLKYLSQTDFDKIYEHSHKLSAMINSLINKIK